jgi:hypothetical protein
MRIIGYALVLIAVQVAIVVLTFVISGWLKVDMPLVIIMSTYLPTISLIQVTGNFVGCSNMIEPFLFGVPLGIATYGLIGSLVINAITRSKRSAQ